jgi:DNA-binding SARP family transcriptional activator
MAASPALARERVRREPGRHAGGVINVHVLGPLALSGSRGVSRRASTEELIAYLALHRHGATADELTEALWPGSDPSRSRRRLWQSTSEARRVLGPAFRRERDRYILHREHAVVDADELEALLADVRNETNSAARDRLLEDALALFRTAPLAGADYRWAESELRRLRAIFVDLAQRVGRSRLEARDHAGALDASERALQVDPLNEQLWRLAMEAESALGLRTAVARRYETLRELLAEELGLEPERETRSLYRRLLAQA